MSLSTETSRHLSATFANALTTLALYKRRLPRLHPKVDHAAIGTMRVMAGEPRRISAIAEATHADLSVVSRQVSALTAAGMATKVSDPDDGRASLVALTPEGEEFVSSLTDRRATWMHEILHDWSDQDARDFDRLLEKFSHSLIAFEKATDSETTTAKDTL